MNQAISTEPGLIDWLKQNAGSHEYLNSVLQYYQKFNRLTPRQWTAVAKFVRNSNRIRKSGDTTPASADSVKVWNCNIPLDCNRKTAKVLIAKYQNASITKQLLIFTYNIIQVKKSSNSNRITVKLVPRVDNLSMCICCGSSLTDWRSIATGVGPVCASRTGIPYVKDKNDVSRFKLELANKFQQLGEIEWELNDVRLFGRYTKNGHDIIKHVKSLFDGKSDLSEAKPDTPATVNAKRIPEAMVTEILMQDPALSYHAPSRTFTYSVSGKPKDMQVYIIHNPLTHGRVAFEHLAWGRDEFTATQVLKSADDTKFTLHVEYRLESETEQ
jgi:hypothetical protein